MLTYVMLILFGWMIGMFTMYILKTQEELREEADRNIASLSEQVIKQRRKIEELQIETKRLKENIDK